MQYAAHLLDHAGQLTGSPAGTGNVSIFGNGQPRAAHRAVVEQVAAAAHRQRPTHGTAMRRRRRPVPYLGERRGGHVAERRAESPCTGRRRRWPRRRRCDTCAAVGRGSRRHLTRQVDEAPLASLVAEERVQVEVAQLSAAHAVLEHAGVAVRLGRDRRVEPVGTTHVAGQRGDARRSRRRCPA